MRFLFNFFCRSAPGQFLELAPRTSNNEERTLPSQAPSVPWLTAACQNLGVQGMQVSLESSTAVAGARDLDVSGFQKFPKFG